MPKPETRAFANPVRSGGLQVDSGLQQAWATRNGEDPASEGGGLATRAVPEDPALVFKGLRGEPSVTRRHHDLGMAEHILPKA